MYIRLNVLQSGSGSQIIAYTEPHDAPYKNDTMFTRLIRIWHNQRTQSLTSLHQWTNYDNDNYVTFRSSVPFETFCKQFSESEYNKPIRYDVLSHNCAHAAHYALGLANINIPLKFLYLLPLSANSWVKIPTNILSPLNIFYMARDHKDHQINHAPRPLSRVSFQVELAATKLGFWARTNSNHQQRRVVETIAEEIQKTSKVRPHHNEQYLETVYQTLDSVLHGSEIPKGKPEGVRDLFREREMSKHTKAIDNLVNGLSVNLGVCIALSLLNHNLNWRLPTSDFMNDTLAVSLIPTLILLAVYYQATTITKADQNQKAPVIDTPLSQAVEQLKNASSDEQSAQLAM